MTSKKKDKDNTGRIAIDALKTSYQAGKEFVGTPAIAGHLRTSTSIKEHRLTLGAVANWDRQARYELADAKVFITPPGPRLSYQRTPKASPQIRRDSLKNPELHFLTRVRNVLRMAEAASAQPDATREEIRRAEQHRMLVAMVEVIVESPVEERPGPASNIYALRPKGSSAAD